MRRIAYFVEKFRFEFGLISDLLCKTLHHESPARANTKVALIIDVSVHFSHL